MSLKQIVKFPTRNIDSTTSTTTDKPSNIQEKIDAEEILKDYPIFAKIFHILKHSHPKVSFDDIIMKINEINIILKKVWIVKK